MKSNEYEKTVAPFRKKINALTVENEALKKELRNAKSETLQLGSEKERLQNWVDRLLEYMEMSPEDLKAALKKDKAIIRSSNTFEAIMEFANRLGGY